MQGNSYNASDVIGVYPLLSNGTCRFMVFDFDNHDKEASIQRLLPQAEVIYLHYSTDNLEEYDAFQVIEDTKH